MPVATPSQPDRRFTFRLQREWHHWSTRPLRPLCLLVLVAGLAFVLNPLLPLGAYALWLWASGSWAWRDRWTSIWLWAKQGTTIVTLIVLMSSLSLAHVWVFPTLTDIVQTWWRNHLPGVLSLWPTDKHSVFARTVLLLPLAPALALLAEWIDPRTVMHPQRILFPDDLITKEPEPPEKPPLPDGSATVSMPPTHSVTKKPRKRQKKAQPPQQITIDSLLPAATVPSASSTPVSQQHQPPATSATSFDWNDVAE